MRAIRPSPLLHLGSGSESGSLLLFPARNRRRVVSEVRNIDKYDLSGLAQGQNSRANIDRSGLRLRIGEISRGSNNLRDHIPLRRRRSSFWASVEPCVESVNLPCQAYSIEVNAHVVDLSKQFVILRLKSFLSSRWILRLECPEVK